VCVRVSVSSCGGRYWRRAGAGYAMSVWQRGSEEELGSEQRKEKRAETGMWGPILTSAR
jgi:hypothetical protein